MLPSHFSPTQPSPPDLFYLNPHNTIVVTGKINWLYVLQHDWPLFSWLNIIICLSLLGWTILIYEMSAGRSTDVVLFIPFVTPFIGLFLYMFDPMLHSYIFSAILLLLCIAYPFAKKAIRAIPIYVAMRREHHNSRVVFGEIVEAHTQILYRRVNKRRLICNYILHLTVSFDPDGTSIQQIQAIRIRNDLRTAIPKSGTVAIQCVGDKFRVL